MSLEFTTARRRREPIVFTLDGEEFKFDPPKTAGVLLEYAETGNELGPMLDWLDEGLSDDDSKKIMDRLKDPEDDFDSDKLGEIVSALFEQVAGRPTRRSSGSRVGRSQTGRR